MKRYMLSMAMLAVVALILTACAPATPQVIEREVVVEKPVVQTVIVEKEVPVERGVVVEKPVVETVVVEKEVAPALTVAPSAPGEEAPRLVAYAQVGRKIIKDAELELLVQDTDVALDRLTAISTDFGGYVLSTNTWYENGYKIATVTIAVPVDTFENALRRVRALALKVEKESAFGQDVTELYVDLESQVRNLEATADRIREFLEKAATAKEALEVNQQLSDVEQQIEERKGKMTFLRDRAAFSTITVTVHPERPTPTPTGTPTLTPIPTPTPTPTPWAWMPGQTYREASRTLSDILKSLGDISIWGGVVCLPFVIPAALVAWAIYRWQRSRRTRQRQLVAPPPEEPQG
jgi:hypothetical protein